jgi:hypothetical protein
MHNFLLRELYRTIIKLLGMLDVKRKKLCFTSVGVSLPLLFVTIMVYSTCSVSVERVVTRQEGSH